VGGQRLKFQFLAGYKNIGLLIIRLGLGMSFVVHGFPKMFGGPHVWQKVGGAMSAFGVHVAPTFWGFMAAFAELGGGILMILGFYFRPAVLSMAITMSVALRMHLSKGDPFNTYSHALELAIVFVGLLFVRPGRFSLDRG
jgi:putative oxidoreductase